MATWPDADLTLSKAKSLVRMWQVNTVLMSGQWKFKSTYQSFLDLRVSSDNHCLAVITWQAGGLKPGVEEEKGQFA